MIYASPQVDLFVQQFNALALSGSVGSKVFYAQKQQPHTEASLSGELKFLKKDCSEIFNKVFQFVHQRQASLDSIPADHQAQVVILTDLEKKINTAWNRARGFYNCIAFMEKPVKQIEALTCAFTIECLASRLLRQTKSLTSYVTQNDKEYDRALAYYKTSIKACEKLTLLSTCEEKVLGLKQIAEGVLAELDKNPSYRAYDIPDALYMYIRYAIASFKRGIPKDKNALVGSLEALDLRITQKCSSSCIELVYTESGKLPLAAVQYEQQTLPAENHFRSSSLKNKITFIPFLGRYSAISPQITKLEEIAKSLFSLECTVNEWMDASFIPADRNPESVYASKFADYRACCVEIQKLVGAQVRALAEVPMAEEVHAGWNYAAALATQAQVLLCSIDNFSKDIAVFGAHVRAFSLLTECAKDKVVGDTRFNKLCQATEAMCAITKELTADSRVYTVLSQVLTQIAAKSLVPTEQEQQVAKNVLKGISVWDGTVADAPEKMYLTKGFMTYLHFPPGAHLDINPEFQKVLYTLKYDPRFKYAFQACLQSCEHFKNLHDAYIGQHDALYTSLVVSQIIKAPNTQANVDDIIVLRINEPAFEERPLIGMSKTLLYQWVYERFVRYLAQPEPDFFGLFSTNFECTAVEQRLLVKLFTEYYSNEEFARSWRFSKESMQVSFNEFKERFSEYLVL